jgi:Xaa-Pro aminopeptidase
MDKDFFIGNRLALSDRIGDGVIVLSAHTAMQRGNDASFAFEQEASFWYLTGISEPDWHVIIDTRGHTSWLVAPDVSDTHQIFDGSLSHERALVLSGIDTVIPLSDMQSILDGLAANQLPAFGLGAHPHADHFDFTLNPCAARTWDILMSTFAHVNDCRLDMARLRAIKQPIEIDAIKRAIAVTIDAFENVKMLLPTLSYEYDIEAEFSYAFKKSGGYNHAYDPIVASGQHACTLHYNANNTLLVPDSIVLLDIGARVDGYAADISRSYACGNVSDRAKQVHQSVADAHRLIIDLIKPGLHVREYHDQVDAIMQQALVELGLIESISDVDGYRRYFPHAISHGLGIDVHDSLGAPTVFAAGMVLTVEPGIYIPEEGIGVRIEDDILITPDGNINLSATLPIAL